MEDLRQPGLFLRSVNNLSRNVAKEKMSLKKKPGKSQKRTLNTSQSQSQHTNPSKNQATKAEHLWRSGLGIKQDKVLYGGEGGK